MVLECDRPTSGAARYALQNIDEVVVGRGPGRSAARRVIDGVTRLMVEVPGRSMSSTHARLRATAAGWMLEDAGSTNGSFVNGKRVERKLLANDELFELGHTIFSLRTDVPTPRGTSAVFDSAQSVPAAPGLATLLPVLAQRFESLARFASADVPILLLGETGTGKEVVSRAVHHLSGRSGPFVAVNCAALPATLVESQLFGHVKGSFSGATRDEPGFFRSANKGTLLLDEIGDFPAPAQAALLRVLQEREVVPVGTTRPIAVDARVIAATNRPLDAFVHQDRFRADLFARIDGHRCQLPPLRARREDLGILVAAILADSTWGRSAQFTADAGFTLASQAWPFNVRELVQRLREAVLMAPDGIIRASHLERSNDPMAPSASCPTPSLASRSLSPTQAKLKQQLLVKLEESHGNIAEVARQMGKARMQIHRWIRRFGIERSDFTR